MGLSFSWSFSLSYVSYIFVEASQTNGYLQRTLSLTLSETNSTLADAFRPLPDRQILEFDTGDTIGCHLDMDRGTLRFSKNGIEIDKFFTNITGEVFPVASFDHVDDQVTVTKRVRKYLFCLLLRSFWLPPTSPSG